MTNKRIIYYILASFIVGNFILIYIQYNSAKNINTLIGGNEQLLNEFRTGNDLKELEKDILAVESQTRGAIASRDTNRFKGLDSQIGEVETDLDQLQKISDDDSSVKYIDILDKLIHEKLSLNQQILDSFHIAGKSAAESMIGTRHGREISDSITFVTQVIDSSRQQLLAKVTDSLDTSGKKALRFGTILIVMVVLSGTALFWYVISTIRSQNQLIQRLDISEKKAREAAAVKENFMANMSHEIRTPLNAIIGFTNLLQQKNLDKEGSEFVQTIHKSGESLLEIINDILDLSRIEAGMMRIESAPFSIRSLVHNLEALFSQQAQDKKLLFKSTIDPLLPDILEGDATRISQILVNLIGNAIKFTNAGEISLAITNSGKEKDRVLVSFEVSDTGIGISADKLPFIFDRFQQAEDSTTRKYGGTGLGLSIVKDLVGLQHGSITVKSEPSKGTTFNLQIPLKITHDPGQEKKLSAPETIDAIHASTSRVLVVEDNEINHSLLRHLFNQWRIEFELATNGKEALRKLQVTKYDLVLMDIQMPEMDGYTTTTEIRMKLRLNIPIIAMTAHALAGEREKCLGYGMNDYISKPIRQEELLLLLRQYLPVDDKGENVSPIKNDFSVIDLGYMQEISAGDREYERTVTQEFLESFMPDIEAMESAIREGDYTTMRQKAHNLKTTVSIMGLSQLLDPELDAIEYSGDDDPNIPARLQLLKETGRKAEEEAKEFLRSIQPHNI